MKKLSVRVFKRSRIGTTLVWNSDVLTPEQKSCVKIEVRKPGEPEWSMVETKAPPPFDLSQFNEPTDTTMIVHGNGLDERAQFFVKISFGNDDVKSLTLEIMPLDSGHDSFVKPKRVDLGNGQVVYSQPVFIAGISQDVVRQIASEVNKLSSGGDKEKDG